jgi:hypothetical protein
MKEHYAAEATVALPDSPVALAVGFEMRLYSRSDISTWVDERVARVDDVAGPLLDLTTLRDKDDGAIATLLFAMTGPVDEAEVGRIGLAVLHQMLITKQMDLRLAIGALRHLRFRFFSDEHKEYTECLVLDDEYDLAADGTYGTLVNVERDLLAFLESYAERLER